MIPVDKTLQGFSALDKVVARMQLRLLKSKSLFRFAVTLACVMPWSPVARADLLIDHGPVTFAATWSRGAYHLARCVRAPGIILARINANCPRDGEFPELSSQEFEARMLRAWDLLNPGAELDLSRLARVVDLIRRPLVTRVGVQNTMHPQMRDLFRAVVPVFRDSLPGHGDHLGVIQDGISHYLTLMTYQNQNNDPVHAHTFISVATLLRSGTEISQVDEFTISWLPASRRGAVDLLADPEIGRNYSLAETLQMVRMNNRLPLRWGPFPVSPELRDQLLRQKQYLDEWAAFARTRLPPGQVHSPVNEQGRTYYPGVFYKALDRGVREASHRSGFRAGVPAGAVNCFHAISDAFAASAADMLTNFDARGYLATWEVLEYVTSKAGSGFLRFPPGPEWSAEFMMLHQPVAEITGVAEIPHAIGVPECRECRAKY